MRLLRPSKSKQQARSSEQDRLPQTEIHNILTNERRRAALRLLEQHKESAVTIRELSERIAELETGVSPAPRDRRHSVYVSLQQNHLPILEKSGIIEHDSGGVIVTRSDDVQELYAYLETVPKYGISWSEYYFCVAVLSLLAIVASVLGVPLFASIRPLDIGVFFFGVQMVSSTIQTWQQGNSIVTRLFD